MKPDLQRPVPPALRHGEVFVQESQLILVDGMPGTGKSTLSQLIHRKLRAAGRRTVWCHEESSAHPVRLFYEPNCHRSWADYFRDVESCWQHYAGELSRGNRIAVLELIVELVLRIEKVIAVLDPVFVYLQPKDVAANFRDVIESRGTRLLQLWIDAHDQYPYSRAAAIDGYSAFIAFWKDFDALCRTVFDRLKIKKLRKQVYQAEWSLRDAEILDFLDCSPRSESVDVGPLERFAGRFNVADDPTAPTVQMIPREEHLEAIVEQPTMSIECGPLGCFRQTRLIPQARNQFYIAGWPHEVHFTEGATGAIETLTVTNSTAGWPPMHLTYCKLP